MKIKVAPVVKRQNDSSSIDRLFLIVLNALYSREGDDLIASYQTNKYQAASKIHGFVNKQPFPNEFQRELNRLAPAATSIGLYIGIHKRSIPTHALSLKRADKGLWRLVSHRMRVILTGEPPRDGILAYWGELTPPADIAAGIPLNFMRITRGGRACSQILDEVDADWEIRRQLTHCILVAASLDALAKKPTVSVWNSGNPGKAVLSYFTLEGNDDTHTIPLEFKPLRTRPHVRPGAKFRVKIYGDAPVGLLGPCRGKQSRYFATEIKNAVIEDDDAFGSIRTRAFIQEILEAQIVPLVGLAQEDGSAKVYALHYCPETKEINPAFITQIQHTGHVPAVKLEGRYFTPNFPLLDRLKNALLADEPPEAHCRNRRIGNIMAIMGQCMPLKNGLDAIFSFYQACLLPFSEDEKTQLWEVYKCYMK